MNGLDKTTRRRKALYLGTTALSPPARLLAVPMLGVALLATAPAAANPTGGTVVGGATEATISGEGTASVTIDQTADRAVIDWTSFGISTGETTTFNQPSAGSITLNRVTGGTQSAIWGNLTANGQVWLINPNGVVMNTGSVIDTAGFLATTADITDADFLDNDVFNFDTASAVSSAVVTNAGSITVADTGLVALMAPGVENSGTITANLGTVKLGGVETFTLDMTGGLVAFSLETAVATALTDVSHQVSNSGSIFADGGTVTLSAKAVSDAISSGFGVNMSGVIQAQSVASDKSGAVVLSADNDSVNVLAGTIDASGQLGGTTGGTVDIGGTNVSLTLVSVVDVTGLAGGGSIDAAASASNVDVKADLLAGDGRVTLSSGSGSQITQSAGQITAGNLDMLGGSGVIQSSSASVTTSGTLTLSGSSFIAMTGTSNAISGPISAPTAGLITLKNGASVATTTLGDISAASTVTLDLAGGGLVQQAGTSITATTLTVTAAGDVTLMEAGNDVNAISIAPIATGSFAFRDANTFGILAPISATDVTLEAGGALSVTQDITATGGNVSLSGTGVTFSADSTVDAGSGTLSVDGGAGTIATAFDGGLGTGSLLLTTGTVDLAADEIELATGSQTGGSALATGQAATVILRPSSGGQSVEVAGIGGTGALDLTAAEIGTVRSTDLRLGDPGAGGLSANAWSPSAGTAPGVLTLASGGNINQSGAIDLSTSGSNLILRAGTGVTLNNAANDFNRVAGVSSGGSINLTDANTITIAELTDDLGTVTGLNAPGGHTVTAPTVIWEVGAPVLPGNRPEHVSVPPQAEAAAGKVCDPTSGPGKSGGTAACGGGTGRGAGKPEKLLSAEGLEIVGLD